MNKALLVGRLTKDPELQCTPTGRNVCQFSIAVNRPYTNEEGERKADFINCVVWDKQAENLCNYQKKGNQIAVEGRIQTRNYDGNDGKKVYVTEILVNNVSYLESKGNRDNLSNLEEPPLREENIENDPFEAFGDIVEINDNDLPF